MPSIALKLPGEQKMVQHVIDGGSLLHRLQWPRCATFHGICSMYVDFVKRNYNTPTVVFDSYMDLAHALRIWHICVGQEVL